MKKSDAAFRLLVRPLTTLSVNASAVAASFENGLFLLIEKKQFHSPVGSIVVSPMIFDETLAKLPPDTVTLRVKEKAVFVSVSIGHLDWVKSPIANQLSLISDNVAKSLNNIPGKYLMQEDHVALLDVVDQVYAHLQSQLLH